MITSPAPRHAAALRRFAAALLLTLAAGCESELFTPEPYRPTPAQAARDVFNPEDPDIRRKAVLVLSGARFGNESPYVQTYRTLLTDPDPTVRAAALRALGRHGEPTDAPAIAAQLKNPAKNVRWEAAVALQRLHHPPVVPALIQAMNQDDHPHVRQVCADALGQYAESRVLQALVGALNDRNFSVAWQASQSLELLTGRDFNLDGGRWLDWLNQTPNPFADRRPYLFTVFVRPPDLFDNLQFWKPYPKPTPVPPRGLLAEHPDFGTPSP